MVKLVQTTSVDAYRALIDSGMARLHAQQHTEAVAIGLEAIEQDASRAEGHMLIGDANSWLGSLSAAYEAYLRASELAQPGSFVWAKSAHMAYELAHESTIHDRPIGLTHPHWMVDAEKLLQVSEGVIATLGLDQPGAWKMKGDALARCGLSRQAQSAYQRCRHELTGRLQRLSGQRASEDSRVRGEVGVGEAGEDDVGAASSQSCGMATAALEHAMGILTGLVADDEGNPARPLRNWAPPLTPPLTALGSNGRLAGGVADPCSLAWLQQATGDAISTAPTVAPPSSHPMATEAHASVSSFEPLWRPQEALAPPCPPHAYSQSLIFFSPACAPRRALDRRAHPGWPLTPPCTPPVPFTPPVCSQLLSCGDPLTPPIHPQARCPRSGGSWRRSLTKAFSLPFRLAVSHT